MPADWNGPSASRGALVWIAVLTLTACSTSDRSAPVNPYRLERFAASFDGVAKTVTGALVSDDFFRGLKAKPLLGRIFNPEEYHAERQTVVVIAYSLWQTAFAANPSLIGKTLQLNGKEFTVVGIMPAGFSNPQNSVLWIPLP